MWLQGDLPSANWQKGALTMNETHKLSKFLNRNQKRVYMAPCIIFLICMVVFLCCIRCG